MSTVKDEALNNAYYRSIPFALIADEYTEIDSSFVFQPMIAGLKIGLNKTEGPWNDLSNMK